MRVRILNATFFGRDAVGRSIIDQARFFCRRGDAVQIQTYQPETGVPEDVVPMIVPVNAHASSRDMSALPDVAIYHYSIIYPLIETIGKDGTSLLVYHNVTPPELWEGMAYDREALFRTLHRTGEFAAAADLVITPSAHNRDVLVNEHGVERGKIRVVPFAIDPAVFHPGARHEALVARYGLSGRRVILFAGRMAGNKRIELLVDALVLVKAKCPQAALLLVGDQSAPALQPSVERVRARVNELGLQRDVIFAGMVDDLADHYRLADVYATASIHEGFGVPLLEAMASGVPVVATSIAAHAEVAGDAGVLCETDSAEAMAAAILRVLESPSLRAELSARGLARAAEFTRARHDKLWEHIVAEVAGMNLAGTHARYRLWTVAGRWGSGDSSASLEEWQRSIESDLQRLDALADVMLRDYRVQSRARLVGRLITWIRKNSTSHLREPYLDPTLERQVIFNRQIMRVLVRILRGVPMLASAGLSDAATGGPAGETARPAEPASDAEARLARIEERLEHIMEIIDARAGASSSPVSGSDGNDS